MTFPSTLAGWQCPHCWQWVASGQYHTCQNSGWNGPNTYGWPFIDLGALGRIADALEKLVAHLTPAPPDSATTLPKIKFCPTCGTAIGVEDEPAEPVS